MNIRKLRAGLLAAALLLSACAAPAEAPPAAHTFTDALGYEVRLNRWERVVSLYGSFAEAWLLAGGELAGTTSDAIRERALPLGEDVATVGTVKEPNLEAVIAAEPDFVILAADIAAQAALHDALTAAAIPHAYYRTDTFPEYLAMLDQFCTLTGRQDLYRENGLAVQEEIDTVLASVEGLPAPSVLLIRAYSSGAKAKGADNLAGIILRDLGCDNLADRHESLLEELSMEEIMAADPDYLLITTMGSSDEAAMDFINGTFAADPAWGSLSAVENGRCILLPRELFHYKPNTRWGESYAYLADILYPN